MNSANYQKKELEMKFGDRLRFLREEAGFSQDDVARSLRLDRAAVSQWEGNRRSPHLKMARVVAGLFGVSMDFFVEAAGDPPTEIEDLKAFLRVTRRLRPEDAASLIAFAQYVAQPDPEELKARRGAVRRTRKVKESAGDAIQPLAPLGDGISEMPPSC